MDEKNRKRVMKHRWTIAGIIALVITTLMHLWVVILWFAFIVGFTYVFLRIIVWLVGGDLDESGHKLKHPYQDTHESNDVSDTMWDIYNTDQTIRHQEQQNDFHDFDK